MKPALPATILVAIVLFTGANPTVMEAYPPPKVESDSNLTKKGVRLLDVGSEASILYEMGRQLCE